MNIRPDAWRRAFRSPQVIVSILALLAALAAVFVAQPEPVELEHFELPVIEPRQLEQEELRIVIYDRFNLQVPLRQTLAVPGDEAGRAEVITEAVRERMQGENGSWPQELGLPVVFVTDLGSGQAAVLDFRVPEAFEMDEAALDRVRRSLTETLEEAGLASVVLLWNGERLTPTLPAAADDAD